MARERPILFRPELVREILAGRKTQTRRPVKPHLGDPEFWEPRRPGVWDYWHPGINDTIDIACPYGEPGDRLWVRETWFEEYDPITARPYDPPRACYAATHEGEVRKMDGDGGTVFRKDGTVASPWRPGIHMPRWASRLTLSVEAVRVERLYAVTDEDARAEGVGTRTAFMEKWDGLYGGGPFAVRENPWVWVVSFTRARPRGEGEGGR